MTRRRSNPLALAVMALLFERPMHPYEMASSMRTRRKEESIRLNYGSLYSVVESLEKRGLIKAVETVREGNRPERTIYAITEPGKLELFDWLSELISTPAKDYTGFEAGLSLLPVLPPDEVIRLLEERRLKLEQRLHSDAALRELAVKQDLPRLMLIEWEYTDMLRRSELAWVDGLIDELRAGTFDGLDLWRLWHERSAAGLPGGFDDLEAPTP
jgi:DNA-binding PadR family transcriptional regulator